MKLQQFEIKKSFYLQNGDEYICTDICQHSIVAIFKNPRLKDIWFQGPPYVLEEVIFEEKDFYSCFENKADIKIISPPDPLYISFFSTEEVQYLKNHKVKISSQYSRLKILDYDRKSSNGDILHPYFIEKEKEEWIVHFVNLQDKYFDTMSEKSFLLLPTAQDQDYRSI